MGEEGELFISAETIEANRKEREKQREEHDKEVNRLKGIVVNFTDEIRQQTKNRIDFLVQHSQETIEVNKGTWEKRENYKQTVIERNISLKYLLQRASDALVTVNTATEPEETAGKGKKKAAGKGKK